jgi:Mrp family chromosome partitioning ATPase/predicted Fe-Mo cluster-binding NifX family protein
MNNIKKKILVMSGKGGVGKSTIAVNLAVWLSMQNKKVGLLDVDIHGPSVPKLLNLDKEMIQGRDNEIEPVRYSDTLSVMSIGFLLPDDSKPVIWRGPMKHTLIKQFVTDVQWGELDYLIVDCPPGTGDEPLSIVQLLENADGAVIVTTPQQIAVIDVKKCITFCRQLNLPVLGVVENMSGLICPHCQNKVDLFKSGGGEQLALDFNVPFLGRIPIDTEMVAACDSGQPFMNPDNKSTTVQCIESAFKPLLETNENNNLSEKNKMKIAIPVTDGQVSSHFGHCEQFAIVNVDIDNKKVINSELITPPPHEPGLLPKWLAEKSVELVIAGGMGQRAQDLFKDNNIDLIVGVAGHTPAEAIELYLNNNLESGQNSCDH